MKCQFSPLTPPLRTGCAFLPLEQPSGFSGRIPRQQCGGKGRPRPVEHFFFRRKHIYFYIRLYCCFLYTLTAGSPGEKKEEEEARSEEKRQSDRLVYFFFFFFKKDKKREPLFSHAWIRGDEIGRVSCSLSNPPGRLGLVVYVVSGLEEERVPFLSSGTTRTDTQGPQVVHKLRRRTNFAKFPRIRPADAKYPSIIFW